MNSNHNQGLTGLGLQGPKTSAAAPAATSNIHAVVDDDLLQLITTTSSQTKIRRPPNAFMLYAREHRRKISKENPNETNKYISTLLGRGWKALPDDVKRTYYDQANILDRIHKQKYPQYVYNPKEARIRKETRIRSKTARKTLAEGEGSNNAGLVDIAESSSSKMPTHRGATDVSAIDEALDLSSRNAEMRFKQQSDQGDDLHHLNCKSTEVREKYQLPELPDRSYPIIGALEDPPEHLMLDSRQVIRNFSSSQRSSNEEGQQSRAQASGSAPHQAPAAPQATSVRNDDVQSQNSDKGSSASSFNDEWPGPYRYYTNLNLMSGYQMYEPFSYVYPTAPAAPTMYPSFAQYPCFYPRGVPAEGEHWAHHVDPGRTQAAAAAGMFRHYTPGPVPMVARGPTIYVQPPYVPSSAGFFHDPMFRTERSPQCVTARPGTSSTPQVVFPALTPPSRDATTCFVRSSQCFVSGDHHLRNDDHSYSSPRVITCDTSPTLSSANSVSGDVPVEVIGDVGMQIEPNTTTGEDVSRI